MRRIQITRTLAAAQTTGLFTGTTGGAGLLTLSGALVSGGVGNLVSQQNVVFTSAGNDSAINFTITGTDDQNRVISEVLAGPNANTVTSVLNYKTVTSINASAAVGSSINIGTNVVGASTEIPVNQYVDPENITVSGEIASGSVNWTVQYTLDDVFATVGGNPVGPPTGGPFVWYNHSTLAAQAASANGTIISPVVALRVLTNSGTGTLNFIVDQAGLIA
jgi:hypothetical protein